MENETGVGPRQDLSPLLRPRSIAIVGISGPDRFGGILYHNIESAGYSGKIFGVNPRYETLYDRPCYPALSDLPEVPDCVLLAVPNAGLEAALEEAITQGVRAAVIFANAHSEPDQDGRTLADRLEARARRAGMVACGPNGMGFVSMAHRLPVTGYYADPETPSGGVTLITHSGSVWDAFLQNDRDLRFNYIISSGSEMVTTVADYIEFALGDASTTVIGLFLETVRDPETFKLALEEAAARDIPVVALKTGRSERGAQLAQAHSGALAGRDDAYDALFERYGVCRCTSIDEMMDTLELFASGMRPRTAGLTALHDSGGQRALLMDLAEEQGLEFAVIGEETTGKLAAVLEPGLDPINPLDAWGTGNEADVIYTECLRALDADPATGLNLFACDLYPSDDEDFFYPKIAEALLDELQNPLAWLVHLSASTSRPQVEALRKLGVPVLMGTETGLKAVAHLMNQRAFQRRLAGGHAGAKRSVPAPENLDSLAAELDAAKGPLGEYQSKKLLAAYGLVIPRERLAGSEAEAKQAASEIGYPVALKTAAGESHKTERGGVRLGLASEEELAGAYLDFEARLGPSVLVQEMVGEGVEILLGIVNDDQFGPMLSLASGGIFVELWDDFRMLALPADAERIREALLGLRVAPMFGGFRGRPAADLEAAVQAALGLSALAEDLGSGIGEVDINPLRVLSRGALVVDALVVPRR